MRYKLADLCEYAREKTDISALDNTNYISTENMMPNKGGIARASALPYVKQTQSFSIEDTLVSNIRPYFKKIWYAKFEGGCSNDVLVFRPKHNVNPRFLYYVLADDAFFEYASATSKGTKMPRGDKKVIMEYPVPNYSWLDQCKIADILSAIDDKIATNAAINKNLMNQMEALYQHFVKTSDCSIVTIADIAKKVAMGPFGSNIKVSTFVDKGIPIISGNHIRGYFLDDDVKYVSQIV